MLRLRLSSPTVHAPFLFVFGSPCASATASFSSSLLLPRFSVRSSSSSASALFDSLLSTSDPPLCVGEGEEKDGKRVFSLICSYLAIG